MSGVYERSSPPSPYWQLQFTHRGQLVRESSKVLIGTTKTERKVSYLEALKLAQEIRDDIDARATKKVTQWSLAEAVQSYQDDVLFHSNPVQLALARKVELQKIPVIRNFNSQVGRIYAQFGQDEILDNITADRIRDWRSDLMKSGRRTAVEGKAAGAKTVLRGTGISKASANTYVRFLMTLLNWADEQGRLLAMPVLTKKRGEKKAKAKPKCLAEDEVSRVMTAARMIDQERGIGPRVERTLMFFFLTGARKTEAFALDWNHVDLANGLITFTEQTKNDTYRKVAIVPALKAVLAQIRAEQKAGGYKGTKVFAYRKYAGSTQWLEPKAIDEQVQKIQELTGMADFHLHLCRHTLASNMLNAGARLEDVQKILGHSDIGTTQIYAHLVQEKANDVMLRTVTWTVQPVANSAAVVPLAA